MHTMVATATEVVGSGSSTTTCGCCTKKCVVLQHDDAAFTVSSIRRCSLWPSTSNTHRATGTPPHSLDCIDFRYIRLTDDKRSVRNGPRSIDERRQGGVPH